MRDDIRKAILDAAAELGVSPLDLGTAVSYETAGTFDPMKKGPTTQWGQHQGLIQWGKPQAQKYLGGDFSVPSQAKGMVGYLRDTGVKPGMGLLDIYSAINAGGVGRYGASDANNGGAPGNVRDKVENQMAGHRKNAVGLLGENYVTDGPKGQESYGPAPATAPFGSIAPRPEDTSIDPGVANYWNNMPGDGERKDTLGNRLANAGKAFDDAIMPAARHGQLPGGPTAEQATGLLKATGNIDQLAKMLFQRRMA
ncbi:MAG: hypothetical protein E5Y67_12340 [Mesorhizobium sp.]|uniref:hypothetical protein n=1 Tax=Mesorhizobium sp. TaxID=1871066 RepID=UPI0012093A4A|nr:hypothetical protein [Mesorhizobium sp.]TIM14461.1 MAG: hypothetical protein E5Y67_12340 [Mesorhizobium sp.]